jgi:hypothetical protein
LIANAPVSDIWPDGLDLTRQIRAKGKGEGLRQGAPPGSNPTVPWADSSSADFHKNLA